MKITKITLVPLRIDLHYLMEILDPLTIIFYAPRYLAVHIYESLAVEEEIMYITQIQYNDILEGNLTDEEREQVLIQEINELLGENIECILAVPTVHFERVNQLLEKEFSTSVYITQVPIPDQMLDLQENTYVYREENDSKNDEDAHYIFNQLYYLLGILLRNDPLAARYGLQSKFMKILQEKDFDRLN